MVLTKGVIYDVTDAVHPRLLCHTTGTLVHLFTGDTFTYVRPSGGSTQVILHSMGSGNESIVATFPLDMYASWGGYLAYTADGSAAANVTQDNPDAEIHVWLASQRGVAEIRHFPVPLADCICRFGLPPQTLSFSPDGQYLVSGWPVGKGAVPLEVRRVSDDALMIDINVDYNVSLWAPNGHRLYVTGTPGSATWTPEGGLAPIPGAPQWVLVPSLSPNGEQVAYTNYTDVAQPSSLRVYVHDFGSQQTWVLVNSLRSDVFFVKDGWVWYGEEVACDPKGTYPGCGEWGTAPSGKTFAMNLATGVETAVVMPAVENSAGWWQLEWSTPEFWPNT